MSVQLPGCLQRLFASCPLQGACTVADVSGDGALLASCFASGAKAISVKGPECDTIEGWVSTSDGALCYARSSGGDPEQACRGRTTTWADGNGTLIATEATGSVGGRSLQITCVADGEQAVCADPANCDWDALTGPQCSAGTCQ